MRKTEPVLFNLLLVAGCYVLVSPLVWVLTGAFLHAFLAWNMILAMVPVLLSWLLSRGTIKKTWIAVLVALAWLLFLPNALYLVTDLIYITEHFFLVDYLPGIFPVVTLDDFADWIALVHLAAGVIIAAYGGTWSLVRMMRHGSKFLKNVHLWLCAAGISLLSGLGVYIGRFFRYNSWNVPALFAIFADLARALSWDLVGFVLLFAALQMGLLVLFKPALDLDGGTEPKR